VLRLAETFQRPVVTPRTGDPCSNRVAVVANVRTGRARMRDPCDTDFMRWTERQTDLLRGMTAGDLADVDNGR
jgi:hypothetical protein